MTQIPEMWKWRSAGNTDYYGYSDDLDSWNPEHLNVMNFGVGFGMYFMFVHFYAWEWLAILLVLLLQFIWQCKNALIPYMDWQTNGLVITGMNRRYFGGFGYSYKHEIYGAAGVLMAFLLDVIWPPAIQPSREEDQNSF